MLPEDPEEAPEEVNVEEKLEKSSKNFNNTSRALQDINIVFHISWN
jgi:hypothetical protein